MGACFYPKQKSELLVPDTEAETQLQESNENVHRGKASRTAEGFPSAPLSFSSNQSMSYLH